MDSEIMNLLLTILLGALLLGIAYGVFRIIVRQEYLEKGRLGWFVSGLELLVFLGFFSFPYTFNPQRWPWFWLDLNSPNRIIGFILIMVGILFTFGTMAWFGLGRAFGRKADEMIHRGPYRWSRNPQILGGYLLVFGTALQWPSAWSLVWILIYGIIAHWMILSEEEFLQNQFGERYRQYCTEVPRYLFWR